MFSDCFANSGWRDQNDLLSYIKIYLSGFNCQTIPFTLIVDYDILDTSWSGIKEA